MGLGNNRVESSHTKGKGGQGIVDLSNASMDKH